MKTKEELKEEIERLYDCMWGHEDIAMELLKEITTLEQELWDVYGDRLYD